MITLTPRAANQVKAMQSRGQCAGQATCAFSWNQAAARASVRHVLRRKKAGATTNCESEGLQGFDRSGESGLPERQFAVDFDDGLHGKGFEIQNPNAQSTCGCGKSFS
jgi:hypothetical protein